ncbi:hypothetical protein [Bradyrhizobium ottawaense]|uniref:hypothetical protein n=1 Tax=Bradyrhizobium ottawaense TaxID=931866 RepID=UPI0035166C14
MHKPMSPRVHFHRSCCAAEENDAGITASAADHHVQYMTRSLKREIFASALGAAHRHSTALHWAFIFPLEIARDWRSNGRADVSGENPYAGHRQSSVLNQKFMAF